MQRAFYVKKQVNTVKELQKTLGYRFKDEKLLKSALTHSSYANECRGEKTDYNERLEFLGDSVLGILVSEYIFKTYTELPEGELTKIRSIVVCENSLYIYAKEIDLGKYIYLGRGEEATNGRQRVSILADAYEALIAAIYLDGGFRAVRECILPKIIDMIKNAGKGKVFKDYKTLLQEVIQQNPEESLEYVLCKEEGPDHNKRFEVEVHLNSNVIGCGAGKSKKEAEQLAAKVALELMGEI